MINALLQDVGTELERFARLSKNAQARWSQPTLALPDYCFIAGAIEDTLTKPIGLTVMAITHGNEVAGLRALNDAAELLLNISGEPAICCAFVLGNVPAALVHKRFTETDLNRSFAATQSSAEAKRAAAVAPILAKSQFFLDLHQTREPSAWPFFIFPHQRSSLAFARSISPQTPVVTHWGDAFSHDGMCSDEYVNSVGGIGITIELGQNGFGEFSVGAGMRTILRAYTCVSQWYQNGKEFASAANLPLPELYTWQEILNYPASGEVQLRPGLINFSQVNAGESIGVMNGAPLLMKQNGSLLFPFYAKPGDTKKPTEICRVMRRIDLSELPD